MAKKNARNSNARNSNAGAPSSATAATTEDAPAAKRSALDKKGDRVLQAVKRNGRAETEPATFGDIAQLVRDGALAAGPAGPADETGDESEGES